VEVDPNGWPGGEDLVQPGDTDAGAAEREGGTAVGAECEPGIGRLDLGGGEGCDGAAAIGDPVEVVVVEGEDDAVAAEVQVGLQVAVADGDRRGEGRHGVLGELAGTAAVGERDGAGPVEEGMQPVSRAAHPRCSVEPAGTGARHPISVPRRARSRLTAALMQPMWVKACGKLPSASPAGPNSSLYRPTGVAEVSMFSK